MNQAVELDIQQFINEANQAAPSDERVISPEGEYTMYVKPGSTKIFEGVSDKDGRKWRRYTALAVIDDANVRAATNLEEPAARLSFFLDITESGQLQIGTNRNLQLGRLLKATGNQKPGWTYGMVEGVPFKGIVKHVAEQNSDRVNAEVRAFTTL